MDVILKKEKLYKLFIDMGHQFKLNLKYFNHVDKFNLDFYDEKPIIGNLFNHKIKEILGPARNPEEDITSHHKDIAKST